MGKYMRNCRGEEAVGAMEVTLAVGVRTRSRAAAANVVVSKRRKALQPDSPARDAAAASSLGGESGSCYLKLRSRMLFMAPPPPAPASAAGAGRGAEELAASVSRCSSTASSVDAAAAQDRKLPCGSDAAGRGAEDLVALSGSGALQAGGGSRHVLEGSASNNSESGLDRERERRETTPRRPRPSASLPSTTSTSHTACLSTPAGSSGPRR